jgi:hypothetical protein
VRLGGGWSGGGEFHVAPPTRATPGVH